MIAAFNSDEKHGHGMEKRRPSTLCWGNGINKLICDMILNFTDDWSNYGNDLHDVKLFENDWNLSLTINQMWFVLKNMFMFWHILFWNRHMLERCMGIVHTIESYVNMIWNMSREMIWNMIVQICWKTNLKNDVRDDLKHGSQTVVGRDTLGREYQALGCIYIYICILRKKKVLIHIYIVVCTHL